jgi:hypothetical protein
LEWSLWRRRRIEPPQATRESVVGEPGRFTYRSTGGSPHDLTKRRGARHVAPRNTHAHAFRRRQA